MATIDLFQGKFNSKNYQISQIDRIYKVTDKYFAFFEDRLKIFYVENDDLKIAADVYISNEKSSRKILHFGNNKIQLQEIIGNNSAIWSIHLDGSIYEQQQHFLYFNPIIYAWNNERITIDVSNNYINILGLDGSTIRKYRNDYSIVWLSNLIFLNNRLYFLAQIQNQTYVLIILDEYSNVSPPFHISFYNQNNMGITISIENDELIIFCPTLDGLSLYYLSKPINQMKISTIANVAVINKAPNLDSIQRNTISMEDFSNIKSKIKREKISNKPPSIDITQFVKLFRHVSVPEVSLYDDYITTEKRIPNPEVIVLENSYMKYLDWIIKNYNNNNVHSVIFTNKTTQPIPFLFGSQTLNMPIDLYSVSGKYDNFAIPFGKVILKSGNHFIRRLTAYNNLLEKSNLDILNFPLKDNPIDNLVQQKNIFPPEMIQKITNLFIILNINSHDVLWTPILFFKVDMRLIRERPIEYYSKVYEIFNKDISLNSLLPYLFFSIIYTA